MDEVMSILGADDVTFYVPPSATPPPTEDGDIVDPAKAWALAGDRHTAADIAAAFAARAICDVRQARRDGPSRSARDRSPPARAYELCRRARRRRARPAAPGRSRRCARDGDPGAASGSERSGGPQDVRADRARAGRRDREALLARHRVPKKLRDVTNELRLEHNLTSAEVELAQRVDGRWDLLSLIKSASVREAEALLAFAHLAEVGVVELG